MNFFVFFRRFCIALLITVAAQADEIQLKEGHPTRYVVQDGDTLWGLSSHFLENPWRWPEIWHANTYIDNPHLIYPGDVLIITSINGKPALKLLRRDDLSVDKASPQIRESTLDRAITTIPPGAIEPFLTSPLVVGRDELDSSGYVIIGVDDNIIMGEKYQFYARGLAKPTQELYQVYMPGDNLFHPVSGEYLGTEAVYLADARLLRDAEVSKLEIIKSVNEVVPKARLLPAPDDFVRPYYHPHAPEGDVLGFIIKAHKGVREIGVYSIVALSIGEESGIEVGHVLRIQQRKGMLKDPVTGETLQLPNEDAGLLMVFRVFPKLSYGLILKATRAMHIGDSVVSPLR
ncbi:MAG: hypothetical protein ACI8P9_002318 [Parasphingorhabdus sp.]|jgi:hypothetical protein